MRQRDRFWCGAVLSALAMFIFLQSIQNPLYSGVAGGFCTLVAAAFFGCGLRADRQEKSAEASKRIEAEQRQLEVQRQTHEERFRRMQEMFDALKKEMQSARESAENEGRVQREYITALLDYLKEWYGAEEKSRTAVLHQLQTDIAAVTEEIRSLHKAAAGERQSHVKTLEQISKDMKACYESERAQAQESAKVVCDSILEQHDALLKVLERQGKESANYYKFMIDQPWAELKALSEMLQSIGVQVDSILSSIDTIQSDTGKQLKKTMDSLKENSKLLRETLQSVCETLEQQGAENRDALERVMQGYSDITAQDMEVLMALTRDTGV